MAFTHHTCYSFASFLLAMLSVLTSASLTKLTTNV